MYQSLPSQIGTLLMLSLALWAFWRGQAEHRLTAAVIAATWLLSGLLQQRSVADLFDMQVGIFVMDVIVAGGVTAVAMRWPRLWVQACAAFTWLQLMTHIAMAVDDRMHWRAYLTALALWSVAQLVSLAWGMTQAELDRRRLRRASRP